MIFRYKLWEKFIIYLGIFLFFTFLLLPFIEAFKISLRSTDNLAGGGELSFDAYKQMFYTVPLLWRYFLNSIGLALSITVGVLCLSLPAAYAFARYEFKGKISILSSLLAVNMLSGAVLLIPLYRTMRTFGILNTYWAMIIPGIAFLIPTSIWLLRSYILSLPKELEEAAIVDGASSLKVLLYIVLPLAMPGVAVVSIATFIAAYAQQFLFAVTFNNNPEFMPLTQGLYEFFSRQEVEWPQLMAASLTATLPVMIVFMFLQKYLIAGLTAGAVKS